ncbi:unnamed protein product [Symbiodinium necroappetens]|uniref:Uncharacterized protein n=1 Tax=Symbiodinium necroappetens TaxID=1628268 RepID=A0A812X3K0_9DINO|nr:unnamed protein product [Symbiodinium necroappetens]
MAAEMAGVKHGGDPVAAGRGAKIRESMKQLLQSKAVKGSVATSRNLPDTSKDAKNDAAKSNEEFFRQLEQDYGRLCRDDGWDEVLRAAREEPSAPPLRPEDAIPAGSDYFRVKLPPGQDRELRLDPARTGNAKAFVESRPRRNLDALRKVEQETREVGDGALVFKALDLQSQQLVSGCEVSLLADWT